MSPRTKQQFQEIREAKISLINQSALELFAYEGYYMTSISMIAKKAGISKGLIYNYYASKEDLLRQIIKAGLEKIILLMDPDEDGIITSKELERIIHGLFNSLKQNNEFWSLYFSIILQPIVMKLVKDQIESIYDKLYSLMIVYFKNQNYEDHVNDAMILGSLFDGISLNYIMDLQNYPIESVKKRLIEMYCK
jgi:AcrR family transcriptional regulator